MNKISVEIGGQIIDRFCGDIETMISSVSALWGKKIYRIGKKIFVPLCLAPFHEPHNFNFIGALAFHRTRIFIEALCYFEFELWGNYYVGKNTRNLINNNLEILSYQTQFTGSETCRGGINRIRFNFNHPISVLFFWGVDRDKIQQIRIEFNDNLFLECTLDELEYEKINNEGYYSCNLCGELKKQICFGCKVCRCEIDKLTRSTPKGYEMDIDFDYLVNLWKHQGGLCAYTGIPMNFGYCKDIDWACSIERIDSMQGYNKNNICLIAAEFNTSIRLNLISSSDDIIGDSGWSYEKFKTFVKHW